MEPKYPQIPTCLYSAKKVNVNSVEGDGRLEKISGSSVSWDWTIAGQYISFKMADDYLHLLNEVAPRTGQNWTVDKKSRVDKNKTPAALRFERFGC
ncbi:hypothetical protein LSTR_LSTR013394 [Laodelphax striatellus]|uniref:Uncharacterized protein n=1 Tax=Laodelphax striatellus TaxID=195883 RepID=A0A482WUG2_LAOST|nr:hypothetical protein LSTR_LSTR013394 [Laodelphax striatellus]